MDKDHLLPFRCWISSIVWVPELWYTLDICSVHPRTVVPLGVAYCHPGLLGKIFRRKKCGTSEGECKPKLSVNWWCVGFGLFSTFPRCMLWNTVCQWHNNTCNLASCTPLPRIALVPSAWIALLPSSWIAQSIRSDSSAPKFI